MPLGAYMAVFVVSGNNYGFDIARSSGYNRGVQINATIRPVPWPSVAGGPQQVVIQIAGTQPVTRKYTAYFYTEVDFENMMALVGASGFLQTPREIISVPAILTNCQSSESLPDGVSVAANLEFVVIG